MVNSQFDLDQKIGGILVESPGQSIMELSYRLKVNRTYLAGYLQSLNLDQVTLRKIGTAKVYFNGKGEKKDKKA